MIPHIPSHVGSGWQLLRERLPGVRFVPGLEWRAHVLVEARCWFASGQGMAGIAVCWITVTACVLFPQAMISAAIHPMTVQPRRTLTIATPPTLSAASVYQPSAICLETVLA